MEKMKKVISLILVITIVLSLTTTAFGEVTINEIPLRVKEKMDSVGNNNVIFTDSVGYYEIISIGDEYVQDEGIVYDVDTHSVSTSYGYGSPLYSYSTMDSGITWTQNSYNGTTDLVLGRLGLDTVYADNSVIDGFEFGVMYDVDTDNIVPFQQPSDLTNYNLVIGSVNQADYTTESWNAYQSVVMANVVDKYYKQEEVNTATSNIVGAQASLVLKPIEADLTAYNTALNAVNWADYTAKTWAVYQTVTNNNIVTASNTQVEVDEATQNITDAQKNLLNIDHWLNYNTVVNSVNEIYYTVESWEAYQLIVTENAMTDENSSSEVNAAKAAILLAQQDLVEKPIGGADMVAYNEALEAVVEADYTISSWGTYQEVVSVNIVTTSNTQEEVDEAVQNIINAQKNLVFKWKVLLDNNKALATKYIESDYTSESWTPVIEALALPENTNDNMGIKFYAIQAALEDLVAIPGNLTEYRALLSSVHAEDYTTESWYEYIGSLSDPKLTMLPSNLNSEIAYAIETITNLQQRLVLAVDKTELNELKGTIANLTYKDYTADSWNALQSALNLPEGTDVEVNNKVATLKDKINKLVFMGQFNLDEAMNRYSKLVQTDYEQYGWEELQIAVDSVEGIDNNNDLVNITTAINQLIDGLVQIPANIDEWSELIDSVGFREDYEDGLYIAYIDAIQFARDDEASIDELQSVVDAKCEVLRREQAKLIRLIPDLTEYNSLITGLINTDYAEISWELYWDAVKANVVTEDNLISEVTTAVNVIKAKRNLLIRIPADIRPINLLIDSVNDKEDTYTAESFELFTTIIENLNVSVNDLQSEIDAKYQRVLDAMKLLVIKAEEEKIDLTEYNRVLELVNEEDYKAQSWLVYLYALSQNEVNGENTQEEIDEAVNNIKDAQKLLILKTDFTEFNAIPELNPSDYTEASWAIYGEVWADIYISINSTQAEVDEAIILITEAQKNLVRKADLTAYNSALAKVKQNDYTEASWKLYQEIIAKNVVTVENTQEEVNLATSNILEAQKSLVKKPIDIEGGSGGGGGAAPPTPPPPPAPIVIIPPAPPAPIPGVTGLEFKVGGSTLTVGLREQVVIRHEISGYVNGYTDNTFRPNDSATRAEVSQVLMNIFETSGMSKPEVTDVHDNEWYSGAVNGLLSAGVMSGYEDRTFRPNSNITRQEFAVTIVNMMNLSSLEVKGEKEFPDIEGIYGEEAIKLLASLGVLSGYPDGTFRPNEEITRAELVVILNRLLASKEQAEVSKIPGRVVFTDIEDSWAREEILRAVGM